MVNILTPTKKSSNAVEILLVLAVCLFALFLRLWRLAEIPVVFFHDEVDNAIGVIRRLVTGHPTIFEYDWKPQPALGTGGQALSFHLFGVNIWALRLPTALISVLGLIPFYCAARIATRSIAASLTTMILLSTHVGYLHFSRTAWENVGVCCWVITDFLLISFLLNRQIQKPKVLQGAQFIFIDISISTLIGLCTALSAMTYFAGRITVVLVVLYTILYIMHPAMKGARWRCLSYLALMLLVTGLLLSPFLWDYPKFFFDTRSSWILKNESSVHVIWSKGGVSALLRYLFVRTGEAFGWIWWPMSHDDRYYPSGIGLLSWYAGVLFLIGCYVSIRTRFNNTGWWWLVLIIPYSVSQVFISLSFNLARGIMILPGIYLFVALGLAHILGLCRKRRAQLLLCVLVAVGGAIEGVMRYVRWVESPEFRTVIEPAIEPQDIEPWFHQMYLQILGKPADGCILPYRKPWDPSRIACESKQK